MAQFVIDEATAQAEFERFAEAAYLDVSTEGLSDDDRDTLTTQRSHFVRAVRGGHLVLNDDDVPVYTPHRPATKDKTPVVFNEPSGADKMAMDRKKDGHTITKTYAMMASACKTSPSAFANMAQADLKVCEAIFALLMGG